MADFPSDQRTSSELELFTYSSTSSTTSSPSSSQTSPDNNPTSAASPPQASCSTFIAIEVVPHATGSSSLQVSTLSHDTKPRCEVWRSLRESTAHAMQLERLRNSEMEHQKAASTHKKATRRLSKDMYQIVSLFAVMEGVVFAAVAQSTVFTCEDWWGPVAVAAAVAVSTVRCVVAKLRRMGYEKQQVRAFERRASAVYDKIAELYWRGAKCNIEELEPDRGDDEQASGGREEDGHCILNRHGVLVLAFLGTLSALIIASCRQMLCRPLQ